MLVCEAADALDAHIVGHELGGRVAAIAVRQHPQIAQSVTIVGWWGAARIEDATGELAKQIEARETEFDPAKRQDLAAKTQQGLRDEAVWVFLYQLDELFGMNKKVEGFKMRADHELHLQDVYVRQ